MSVDYPEQLWQLHRLHIVETEMRTPLLIVYILIASAHGEAARYLTTVSPLPNENIAQPCRYGLMIADPKKPVQAVWVIFERGRDLWKIYNHLEVNPFVRKNRLALMMPYHCREKRGTPNDEPGNDMDMRPEDGLGRALFTALNQFGESTGHSELASSKLILFGFSGTGSLVARMVAFAPDRIVASVSSAPGHWEPIGIDTVELPPSALAVPQLIIANSEDKVSGTERPYHYFEKYSRRGAPMAFVIQNGVPHCCIVNAEEMIIAWVVEVLRQRKPMPAQPLRAMNQKARWHLFLRVRATSTKDTWGQVTWFATDAVIQRTSEPTLPSYIPAGWLPTYKLAKEWLKFVKEPQHPDTSLP